MPSTTETDQILARRARFVSRALAGERPSVWELRPRLTREQVDELWSGIERAELREPTPDELDALAEASAELQAEQEELAREAARMIRAAVAAIAPERAAERRTTPRRAKARASRSSARRAAVSRRTERDDGGGRDEPPGPRRDPRLDYIELLRVAADELEAAVAATAPTKRPKRQRVREPVTLDVKPTELQRMKARAIFRGKGIIP